MALTKIERRKRIKMRIRKDVFGTKDIPRLSVFRSNKQIYVQIIDDIEGKTLLSVSSRVKEIAEKAGITKIEQAKMVGKLAAEKSKESGITAVVFDRNGYLYHGRVKALAEAAREGGLKF
jgi:large subunit ribosomal protein L18